MTRRNKATSAEAVERYTQIALAAGGKVTGHRPYSLDPPPPEAVDESAEERDFQKQITDLAENELWDWHHQTISKRSKSGWTDLVLFRERIVFVEVKAENGRLTADQERWRDIILAAGGEWYCWRPSDWPEVVATLTRRGPR